MSSTQDSALNQISQNLQPPAPATTIPSPHTMANFDSWSQKPQVVDVQYSTYHDGWLVRMQNYRTGFKGGMMVCMDCITVHVYHTCDGKIKKCFQNCDYNRPPYHPDFIARHENLGINIQYIREALNRTPPRHQVPQIPELPQLRVWRGYNPKVIVYRRHISKCFLGTAPDFVIQGHNELATSIYYRRCDGKYRNLSHQVLCMKSHDKEEEGEGMKAEDAEDELDNDDTTTDIDPLALSNGSTATNSNGSDQIQSCNEATSILSTLVCRKRKRDGDANNV